MGSSFFDAWKTWKRYKMPKTLKGFEARTRWKKLSKKGNKAFKDRVVGVWEFDLLSWGAIWFSLLVLR